jgi:hypothetical protein
MVRDVEAMVADLRGKGVAFEDYDLPGVKTVNGIAELGAVALQVRLDRHPGLGSDHDQGGNASGRHRRSGHLSPRGHRRAWRIPEPEPAVGGLGEVLVCLLHQ